MGGAAAGPWRGDRGAACRHGAQPGLHADDAALLQLAADRAALAVQSLRSREDRAATAALQRPAALGAARDRAEIAARYVPGDGSVGGDWYDVFLLPWGAGHGGRRRGRFRARERGRHGPDAQCPALVRAGVPRTSGCLAQAGSENAVFRGRGHGHRVVRRSRPGLGAGADISGRPFPAGGGGPGWAWCPGRTPLSMRRSASPMRPTVRSPHWLWCLAQCCASSPTGWWNAGTSR